VREGATRLRALKCEPVYLEELWNGTGYSTIQTVDSLLDGLNYERTKYPKYTSTDTVHTLCLCNENNRSLFWQRTSKSLPPHSPCYTMWLWCAPSFVYKQAQEEVGGSIDRLQSSSLFGPLQGAFWVNTWMSVCLSVCLSVRPDVCPGLLAHLMDFVWLTITFKHCLGMLETWTNLCDQSVQPSVWGAGQTLFWTGSERGVCSGLFVPLPPLGNGGLCNPALSWF